MSEVWPTANARQWVLTFPHQVRGWFSRNPELFSDVINEVTEVISRFYEDHSISYGDRPSVYAPATGSITFVQLFGSSLVLNPHLHMIFLDGVYARDAKGLRFFLHQGFLTESMFDVLYSIHEGLTHVLKGHGYVRDEGEPSEPDLDGDIPMPFRPRAPKAYRRKGRLSEHEAYLQNDPDQMSMENWCNVRYKWFSLHAGVAIKADDREGLKRLFLYAARSSVSLSQLSYVTPEDPDQGSSELAQLDRSGASIKEKMARRNWIIDFYPARFY